MKCGVNDLMKNIPKKNQAKLGSDMLKLLMEANKDDYNSKEFFS